MIRRLASLVGETVAGQVVLLLGIAILLPQLILVGYFYWDIRQNGAPISPAETTGRMGTVIALFAVTPPDERAELFQRLRALGFPVTPITRAALPPDARRMPPTAALLRFTGDDIRLYEVPGDQADSPSYAFALLPDGDGIMVDWPDDVAFRLLSPTSVGLSIFLLASALLLGWSLIVITRPLRRFAIAVESFSDATRGDPLPEDGPREIRATIAAFNRTRARLARLLDEKTSMLAAVSHDLRTPITRIRLRAEFIDDPEVREPMLRDLDHMAALAQGALTHLSGMDSREAFSEADLPSLLQAIADQFCDLGNAVSYAGPPHLSARIRIRDIDRAVGNLVENAVRYAVSVRIELDRPLPGRLAISVIDDGPGIPADDRDRFLAPFVRGDSARGSSGEIGFGLGLTVARDVAEAHQGRLRLSDARPHGLVATIEIAERGG